MFNSATTCTQYYEMPCYVEKINTSCVSSNATYIDPDKYYNFILINKVYDDRQYIYDLYADNKYFGEEEFEAEEKIIKSNSIPLKDNFLDYYE